MKKHIYKLILQNKRDELGYTYLLLQSDNWFDAERKALKLYKERWAEHHHYHSLHYFDEIGNLLAQLENGEAIFVA